MPEGSTLEQTSMVALEMAEVIKADPTVVNYQVYAGTASPYNFNGLVRHYFMRQGPTVADIQVSLLPKEERSLQSHDIAVRLHKHPSDFMEASLGIIQLTFIAGKGDVER